MDREQPETVVEESPLLEEAPAHIRLTPKQRQILIFLAFAIPLWIALSFLTITNKMIAFVFIGGLFLLVLIYGMRTEYLLFAWLILSEYNEVLKWLIGVQLLGVGVKGFFFVSVLTQLPNKFSLMPRRLFRTVPLRWPFYLLLLWVGASLFWSDFPLFGINRYLTWVMAFFFYALTYLTVNDQNKRRFYTLFAIVVGTSVFFGLLQRFGLSLSFANSDEVRHGLFQSDYSVGGGAARMFRATGFYGHPNGFSRECAFEFCILLMMLIAWQLKPIWKKIIIAMLGVTISTIILSYSRVGWAIFAVGAVTFLILTRPRWLIGFAAAVLIAGIIAWPQIRVRLEPLVQGNDGSLMSRKEASRIYMNSVREQPLTGFGFGSTGGGAIYKVGIVPHEGYVYLLVYVGAVGLFLYLLLTFALVVKSIQVVRNRFVRADRELHAMAALGTAVAFSVALNFYTGVRMDESTWYLLGLSFATVRIAWQRYATQLPAKADATAG